MENKEIIKELVKLQILCIRWVERNTSLKCSSHRDMDRVITANKLTCTYGEGVENLYNNITQYCKDSTYLIEKVVKLKEEISKSDIIKLRFGMEPQKKFNDLEKELDTEMLKRKFFMINEMVGIKEITEILGLTESAVKQACQQQRLLNTKKIGKSWMVHIPECRAYWDIKDEDESHLHKDYIY